MLKTAWIGVLALWSLCAAPAAGQERPEVDQSGKAAVLCVWNILIAVREGSMECQVPRTDFDDAVDGAITDVEAFILANSSKHPTQSVLAQQRDAIAKGIFAELSRVPRQLHRWAIHKFCESELPAFRAIPAAQLKIVIGDTLSVPREPVLNPCR